MAMGKCGAGAFLFATAASYHNLDPPPLPPVKIMLLGNRTVSHSFRRALNV
jgi:hypothetical protein